MTDAAEHVRNDARKFIHDHANVFDAFGRFNAHHFFHAHHVTRFHGHAAQIIEPIGEWNVHVERIALADFFVIAMQIAKDGIERHDRFPVKRDIHPKDAMCGRMLRTNADDNRLCL